MRNAVGLVLGWVIKFEYPVLSFFFSTSFSKVIFKTGELPSLCNIVYSLHQLFPLIRHGCIYLHYCINKQWDTSFELSSILWTVDLFKHFKHLIMAWIIQKFIQLDNFVTFSVFFLFFSNRGWLNLYERELLSNFLKRDFYNNNYGELLFKKTLMRKFIQCKAFLR